MEKLQLKNRIKLKIEIGMLHTEKINFIHIINKVEFLFKIRIVSEPNVL